MALAAMEKESVKAENSSRTAELKIGAFSKQEITDDPHIAAALKSEGRPALPDASARDRLAALRSKKA